MTTVLPARVLPAPEMRLPDRVVAVTDELGAEVLVRWRLVRSGDAWRWRCAACGPQVEAGCAHTFAAGLALAEELLGLTRVPELEPDRPAGQTDPHDERNHR